MTLADAIREQALAMGFDAVGFTTPTLPDSAPAGLREFLDAQYHGDMQWMADKADRRSDPLAIWPDTRSIIMLGVNYAPAYNPLDKLADKSIGNISCYAQNEDYHDVIKKRLKQLARWIGEKHGGDARVYVDTAPVMEKVLGARAGLGWQGKHTCMVSREFGSWLFLGCIFSSLEIDEKREEEKDHCGNCSRCIDICPTQAFTAPRKLDARKCISYLTIENKGTIPLEYRKAIGNRIYGCDDCLAVCPWNKFAEASREMAFLPRETLNAPKLAELAQLDDTGFRAFFSKSPIKRIGRDRFVRNVLIAIGNSGDSTLMPYAERLQDDASEIVSEMARWALAELKNSA